VHFFAVKSDLVLKKLLTAISISTWCPCFPGAQEVRVLRQVESDVSDPRLEMVLSVRYPSRESIELALASEVRQRSREVSKGLIDMFDGTVFHTVFSAEEFPMPKG
jgi:hypothetical protein